MVWQGGAMAGCSMSVYWSWPWSLLLVLVLLLVLDPGSTLRIRARLSESRLDSQNPGSNLRNLKTWLQAAFSY